MSYYEPESEPPTDPATPSAAHLPPPPPSAPPSPPIPPTPPTGFSVPLPGGPARRTPQGGRATLLTVLALVFFLAASSVIGYTIGSNRTSSTSNSSSFPGFGQSSPFDFGGQQSPANGSSGQQNSNIDTSGIADKVDDSIVNITTTLSGGGQAAGTGIVLSSDGLVLTNNHVIENSTSLGAEIAGNGNTYSAKVLGYDVADDIAVVKLENASGLTPAKLGNSSSLSVGDAIVALGNAGGKGGTPTAVGGTVTALGQQITASDEDGANAETLDGLIQVNANVQPGDSGGPLVNTNGTVVGIDTAAASGNGSFRFNGVGENEGYAIPIEKAVAIAEKIESRNGSTNIHIGPNSGILGVDVTDQSTGSGPFSDFGNDGSPSGSGAIVRGVESGSGADKAGIQAGDVITAVNGTSVSSASALTHSMVPYSPKDKVTITWVDSSGSTHHATITLGSGPPK